MKLVIHIVFFLFCINSFAQEKSKNCDIKLTKEAVLKNPFSTSCFNIADDGNFDILSFKIKFIGRPTINISGCELNNKAKFYLMESKIGSFIQIFDIILEDSTLEIPDSIVIEVI